jgi:hypothetical protein
LLAHEAFRQWVNVDLLAAYRTALDTHIIDEIDSASIPAGGGGGNVFEDILFTQEVVRAAGHQPDLVVVSPADALAIQLLVMQGATATRSVSSCRRVTTAVGDGSGRELGEVRRAAGGRRSNAQRLVTG